MYSALKSLLQGNSGKTYKSFPPRGPPILNSEDINEEKSCELPPLTVLRQLMRDNRIGIYLVYMRDEHNSEYPTEHDKRVKFISTFTGSAGTVAVGLDYAELATDSRYYLMAERELSSDFRIRKLGLPNVLSFESGVVDDAIRLGVNVGVDARFISNDVALSLHKRLCENGLQLMDVPNLVDYVWGKSQPEVPQIKVFKHDLVYTGELACSKVYKVRQKMLEDKVNSFVIYSLDEIAYLLNLRGDDVPYVPVFKAFLVVQHDVLTLFTDKQKLENIDLNDHEGLNIKLMNYDQFWQCLRFFKQPVWIPSGGGSWAINRRFQTPALPRTLVSEFSIVNSMRAVKNEIEINNMRLAQLKCSVSIVKYLSWLNDHIDEECITEYSGAEVLLLIRSEMPDFEGNSFETISAVGGDASLPHYTPSETDSAQITRNDIYLLDSGSQFLQGSTDITRSTHFGTPTSEQRKCYTLVLKGSLAVMNSVFPEGRNATALDFLARQYLWREELDYGHGTGHGVGSYLSIHEMPLGIFPSYNPQSDLVPGNIITIEPGYYKDNEFGIRIENDILVIRKSLNSKFVKFENLTYVPYDFNLIDIDLLTADEIKMINDYHSRCRALLLPEMTNENERNWLIRYTNEL